MINSLMIDAPYDSLQFINNLPGYDSNKGVIEMLDLVRDIQQSDNYYWQGLSFPNGAAISVAGNATLNGTIQVPQGSYVTSITHYEGLASEERGGIIDSGFKLKIWDKGTKASIFYGDYSLNRIVSSNMELHYGVGANNLPSDVGMNRDNPFGPAYLMSPFIISSPGVLGWELVNLNAVTAVFQVLLSVAVPINKQSIGHRTVSKG